MHHKFFIFNSSHTSQASADDLATLCQSVTPKADVLKTTFTENLDGADYGAQCFIVIPGGQALLMGFELKNCPWDISSLVTDKRFGYLGICSGAFIGTKTTHVYDINHSGEMKLRGNTRDIGFNLNIGCEATGYGPFIPKTDWKQNIGKLTAHMVPTQESNFPYLPFVHGCCFTDIPESMSVIGRYEDNYTFGIEPKTSITLRQPAFAIRQNATPTHGGMLLSGAHLEACVPDSKFIDVIVKEDSDSPFATGINTLFKPHQPEMFEAAQLLIKDTFNV